MRVFSSIQVAANGIILFFFMVEKYSIVYIYHFFLLQSSVDAHLGCFHVFAIVNRAEGACVFFRESFCPDICPRVGLLCHMVVLLLDF